MQVLYSDDRVVVCVKPAGVLSTDEPGGLPDLVRDYLGDPKAVVRTVHRLDRAVSGLMVLARTARAASDLSAQIREGAFLKEYQAVVHGQPPETGQLFDHLYRDKVRRMTLVSKEPTPETKEALLDYRVTGKAGDMTRVRIRLHTGRTHQIRVQFSSRGWPLVGDKKYFEAPEDCGIALWSCALAFRHPRTGEQMRFELDPPNVFPWSEV